MKIPCDVCLLVDKDSTPRFVSWCDTCKAYLCEPCSKNPVRRGKAWVIRKVREIRAAMGPSPF